MQADNRASTLTFTQRIWVYMPFMHSEVLADQERCIALFTDMAKDAAALPGGEGMAAMLGNNVKYAVMHRDVVKRWGRFPHRNAIVGRDSTPEEAAGMADGSIASF